MRILYYKEIIRTFLITYTSMIFYDKLMHFFCLLSFFLQLFESFL